LEGHVIVRDALAEEFPAVGELRVDAYLAQGLIAPGSGYDETLRGLGFAGDAEVLVAAEDGKQAGGPASGRTGARIVGTVLLVPWSAASELAREPDEAELRAFAVAPGVQGRGVGRLLLRGAIGRAAGRGVTMLRLCTQPAMTAAQRLYASEGFARTPERDWSPLPGLTLLSYELPLAGWSHELPVAGR
jgi:ribosomal protein S18 acetylase RimI-like enzyme